MRIVLPLMLLGALAASGAEDVFGIWRVELARSTAPFSDIVAVRFEPHERGEVFTVERVYADGRATTSSSILYFDTRPRDFQDSGCSGTQSSRRLDDTTAEILHKCADGRTMRIVRRFGEQPRELVLEITEQRPAGWRAERRLRLEKESGRTNGRWSAFFER
jgi:hypothetical protein